MSPDGKVLYVTSRRPYIAPYGEPLISELTVVNDETERIAERKSVESAYMMENIAFTPSGDLAFVTMIRPKNLVPSIQVEQGWMMTHGIVLLNKKGKEGLFSYSSMNQMLIILILLILLLHLMGKKPLYQILV